VSGRVASWLLRRLLMRGLPFGFRIRLLPAAAGGLLLLYE